MTYSQLSQFDMQPIELFGMIHTRCFDGHIKDTKIDKKVAVEMFCEIIALISGERVPADLRTAVSLIFENEDSITGGALLSKYRDHFEHGRMALKAGLKALMKREGSAIPAFDQPSASILNKSLLAVLRMSCGPLSRVDSIQCLFNSMKHGASFNRLVHSGLGYTAPTIILVKHTYKSTDGASHKGLIGAFSSANWVEDLGYWGNTETFIFTLAPRVRFLYAYKGNGGSNFAYLNTRRIPNSKYKAGFGFGGKDFRDYRIWLDDDLLQDSTTNFNDDTYPLFALNEGYEEKLQVALFMKQIDCIEVWGLGNKEDLARQEEFREMKQTMVTNSRKIDKKRLIQGEFAGQALGKTFGHRDQIEGNIDEMKNEAKEGFDQ